MSHDDDVKKKVAEALRLEADRQGPCESSAFMRDQSNLLDPPPPQEPARCEATYRCLKADGHDGHHQMLTPVAAPQAPETPHTYPAPAPAVDSGWRADLQRRYEQIPQSQWFRDAYGEKPLGEFIVIE